MAERYQWDAFYSQAVYNQPPYPWQRIELGFIPELAKNAFKFPFASKIGSSIADATSHWRENMSFSHKDWVWRAGFAAGIAESAAVTMLSPEVGLIDGGINIAVSQGAYFLINRFNPTYGVIRFAKGLTAGAAYSSMPMGVVDVANTPFSPEGL